MTQKKIIENIFDVICKTSFYDVARKELDGYLKNKNISFNGKDAITIERSDGQIIYYKIEIKR